MASHPAEQMNSRSERHFVSFIAVFLYLLFKEREKERARSWVCEIVGRICGGGDNHDQNLSHENSFFSKKIKDDSRVVEEYM